MGLGGIFGGYVNDHYGWRFVFHIQVPFILFGGLVGFLTVHLPVKKTETSRLKRVDFLGAFTLVAALALLLLGLNSGGNTVSWSHPLVWVSLSLSGALLALFIYVEDRVASEPIIPVRLLLRQTVAAGCVVNWLMTMSVFGLIYYVPIYFQVVQGESSTTAGLLFVPQAIGSATGSLGCGLIMRSTGQYWHLNILTQLVMITACSLIMVNFDETVQRAWPYVYLFMQGLSYGSMLTITLISLIAAVERKHHAVITSASYAFRSTGSTIGITVASAVFQNLLKTGLHDQIGDRAEEIRENVDLIKELPPLLRTRAIQAFVEALRGVWVVALGFAMLSSIASMFIRQQTLHKSLNRQ